MQIIKNVSNFLLGLNANCIQMYSSNVQVAKGAANIIGDNISML